MEEGLYEIDVHTLGVTGLIKDGNKPKPGFSMEIHPATLASALPGYHGKGLYSGQGRVIYANNGEDKQPRARGIPPRPAAPSPNGASPARIGPLVRRNQFTDVTGPGGIFGSDHPDSDPVWSIGWDHRSLILMCSITGNGTPTGSPRRRMPTMARTAGTPSGPASATSGRVTC